MQNRTVLVPQLCVTDSTLGCFVLLLLCWRKNCRKSMENVHGTVLEPNLPEHVLTIVRCSPYGVPLLWTIKSPQTLRQTLFCCHNEAGHVLCRHYHSPERLVADWRHWKATGAMYWQGSVIVVCTLVVITLTGLHHQ